MSCKLSTPFYQIDLAWPCVTQSWGKGQENVSQKSAKNQTSVGDLADVDGRDDLEVESPQFVGSGNSDVVRFLNLVEDLLGSAERVVHAADAAEQLQDFHLLDIHIPAPCSYLLAQF